MPHSLTQTQGKKLASFILLLIILFVVSLLVKQELLAANYFTPLFYYLPIIFATYFFEAAGGLLTALVAVFLCMPLLATSNQQGIGNILMMEMVSFFMVGYITNKYLQQREGEQDKSPVAVDDLVDEAEMEKGLETIEPIIRADRERVAFCQIVENIYAFHSLEEKLGVILNTIKNDFSCQACSVLLLTPGKKLEVKISRGLSGSFLKQANLEAEDGVWAEVIKKRREVLIEKSKGDGDGSRILEKDFQSFLALPLISRQVQGIMHMESARESAFTPMDIEVAWDFANLMALLIDNANLLEENRALAVIDKNTGLFNYHYFHQKIEELIKENERYGKAFSIIVLELVNYQQFKTFQGKERTQEILREMANAIKSCLRGVDLVTRIGENEFGLVLPGTELKGAHISADRINNKLNQDIFGSLQPDILLCLGIVEFPADGKSLPSLLAKARNNVHESSRSQRDSEV